MKAISRMVSKVGQSNFLANLTTAAGFGVFYFTKSKMLMEFGVVAALNVMATYTIALIFITIILSYLPKPTLRRTRHLTGPRINKVINTIDFLVHHRRKAIYITFVIITLISIVGMNRPLLSAMWSGMPPLLQNFADHFAAPDSRSWAFR